MHVLYFALFVLVPVIYAERSFIIDYENNQFLKDGTPFRYIAGNMHYFQVPFAYWEDRMLRMRALGLNALQTYISWSTHEPYEHQYQFSDQANLFNYLDIANKLGLLVILRPGPYIDAEQDMGGLPAWLLKTKDIRLRTMDSRYLDAVTRWYGVVFPKLKPYLYSNGGPVIMVQIENEYGSFGCDFNYTTHLADLSRKLLGNHSNVIYFTTDYADPAALKCGAIPGVYATVDFGSNSGGRVEEIFKMQRTVAPKGPLVNSEFYPGWYDLWGNAGHSVTNTQAVLDVMSTMLQLNASFNIYPVHGGTNWGYQSGGEWIDPDGFRSVITSYDFDSPINEAGDPTPKYFAMRQTIERLTNVTVAFPVPPASEKFWYGAVDLELLGNIFDLLNVVAPSDQVVQAEYPLCAEDMDHPYGFLLYETTVSVGGESLNLSAVHDRGYVFVDQQLVRVVQREADTIPVSIVAHAKLQILVENQGRVCYGDHVIDRKGIVGNVSLNDEILRNWTIYPIDLSNIMHPQKLNKAISNRSSRKTGNNTSSSPYTPSLYLSRVFLEPEVGDSFFDPSGWGKGQMFVNGHNVGRYWPDKGPQVTLYVPKVYLAYHTTVLLFELDKPGNCVDESRRCSARFINYPILQKN